MSILTQARNGFGMIIKMNPSIAYRWVYPLKDNGLGVMVKDLTATPSLAMEAVRLSHEKASVPVNTTGATGLDTSFSMFLEAYHDSQLSENDQIIVEGQGWKLGKMDALKVSGDIYGYRAPLNRVKLSSDCEILEASIGNAEGEVDGTSITIELPAGTDVTALEPVFSITGFTISPTGPQDFTEAIEYTVTSENIQNKTYTVTVEVAV